MSWDNRQVEFFIGTLPAAGATDAVIRAAVPGRRIRVLGARVFPTVTPPASFTLNTKGSGAGTAISPVFPLVASTPFQVPSGEGLCQTLVGEALTVTNPAGTTLAVYMVSYVVIN